jgi:RNA polymerase sigma-70 factor (ECF subfamily)
VIFFILLSAGIEKVSKSTAEAFSLFYEEYLPKIFKYINYKISDRFLAEDLTSAVFEKALTKYETYSSKKAAISTWVFTIARNTLIDYYRAANHEKTAELDDTIDLPQENSSPEQAVIDEEKWGMLQKCMLKLPENEREIVSMKFSSQMTNRQIAGLLGLSDSNVGVILYRAIHRLRDNFEGWQYE